LEQRSRGIASREHGDARNPSVMIDRTWPDGSDPIVG